MEDIISILEIALIMLIVVPIFIKVFRLRRWLPKVAVDSIDDNEGSLLMAYYSKGLLLQPMSSGKVNDMYYGLYITMLGPKSSRVDGVWAPAGTIIYRLELPFNTQAHIVGLGKVHNKALPEISSYLGSQGLLPVGLEGDFEKYFLFFAGSGQEVQARYVFDPAAMEFVVDYCQSTFWEIVGDEMYFTSEPGQKGNDFVRQSIAFVNQIQPAILQNFPDGGKSAHHEAPYGEYRGKPMKCPVCSKELIQTEYWHECPEGHGRLLHGGDLYDARNGEVPPPVEDQAKAVRSSGILLCPHCGNPMQKVNYQLGSIIIDSCAHCPYRWCDAGELSKIIPKE